MGRAKGQHHAIAGGALLLGRRGLAPGQDRAREEERRRDRMDQLRKELKAMHGSWLAYAFADPAKAELAAEELADRLRNGEVTFGGANNVIGEFIGNENAYGPTFASGAAEPFVRALADRLGEGLNNTEWYVVRSTLRAAGDHPQAVAPVVAAVIAQLDDSKRRHPASPEHAVAASIARPDSYPELIDALIAGADRDDPGIVSAIEEHLDDFDADSHPHLKRLQASAVR